MPLKKVMEPSPGPGSFSLSQMLATSNPGAISYVQIVTAVDPQVIEIQGRLSDSEGWTTLLSSSVAGLYQVPLFPQMQINLDIDTDSSVYMWT